MSKQITQERIIQLIWSTQLTVPTNGMSERDAQAMGAALWNYRHNLIAAIKEHPELAAINDLPKYHCPDCKDWDCLHCFCVDEPNCNACIDFAQGQTND